MEDKKYIDKELWEQAISWANNITDQIEKARKNPTISVSGEAERIYGELEEIGWFEGLCVKSNSTINFVAFQKYGKLKWAKDHPAKNKPKVSKWERVTGANKKR